MLLDENVYDLTVGSQGAQRCLFILERPQPAQKPFVFFLLFFVSVLLSLLVLRLDLRLSLWLRLFLRFLFLLGALEGIETGKQTWFDDHSPWRGFEILPGAVHRYFGSKHLGLNPGGFGVPR